LITIDLLIKNIYAEQSSGEEHFPEGIFRSYRYNPYLFYQRDDTNVSLTSMVIYILQEFHKKLSPQNQVLVDEMITKTQAVYPLFKHRKGLDTYNFFLTNAERHLPHSYFLRHFGIFKLADDIDDTAMVYLTSPFDESKNKWLKDKALQHANTVKGLNFSTLPHYRQKKIYSSWFGENMPIDFDICALANFMIWSVKSGLTLNEFDLETIEMMRSVILNSEYKTKPFWVAPYYYKPVNILYHIGRFIASTDFPQMTDCKGFMINQIKDLLQKEPPIMEQIMLATTLIRLGESPPKIDFFKSINHVPIDSFDFFVAPFFLSKKWSIPMAHWKISHIFWRCPAHTYSLILEYLCLYEV
jgi:hypothetical protein